MENIIRVNRVFAEFMGYEIISYNGSERLIYNGNKERPTIGGQKELWGGLELQFTGRFIDSVKYPFETDFRYLIPIIRRIEESGYVVSIADISYKIYKVLDEDNPIVSLVCGDFSKKTELTCELLVSFIEKEIFCNKYQLLNV